MENLVMVKFGGVYTDRRVLVTGNTGFKGSWLTLWLEMLGAQVFGCALKPDSTPNHWHALNLDTPWEDIDINNAAQLEQYIRAVDPEMVFHLAAQPLVRESYNDPLLTWQTNVCGTANLLNACRYAKRLKAITIVTTDKCYQNLEWPWGYRENDRLGGHDPYSASKAGTELVVESFRKSFFHHETSPLLATARAGNVIGGGDWSKDRLVPDLVRGVLNGQPVDIRSPDATRPWQHVLECLSGYLLLGQKLMTGDARFEGPWNFGPDTNGNRRVIEVLSGLQEVWKDVSWEVKPNSDLHEAKLLHLDSSKSHSELGWEPIWSFSEAIEKTAMWYRSYSQGEVISRRQILEYVELAIKQGAPWAQGVTLVPE